MQCPWCDHLNDDGARFCSRCGNGLELRCPTCSAPYEAGANFCSSCGTALTGATPVAGDEGGDGSEDLARYVPEELLRKIRAAQTGQTMRGERRTVTMLFADIQGSTAAAEHLDPEDWAEIMNGAFGHLIAPVYRYEGTLARLQGDAILAFFGAPIAHEDDPVRAVRAGLDIIEQVTPYTAQVEQSHGVPIAVRVGINTGLVVVGEVGSDLRVEYTALGDAINIAARMEQTAEPGTVQVTDQTLRLLGSAFETEPLGPVDVKGKGEPVPAHRVVGYRGSAREPGTAATPLVGRQEELAGLQGAVARLRDGLGGIVTLGGEAGVGKSRLLRALREDVSNRLPIATSAATDGALSWLHGQARSYERGVPHAAFVDLLCTWWDQDPADPTACFDRIVTAHERATGQRDTDVAGLLASLVGAPAPDEQAGLIGSLSAPVLHERTTEAVATYLAAEAQRRPVLLVLDDVHWADDLSLTLVQRLMDVTETAPLMLLLVMRPSRDEPSWQLVEAAARDHAHRHTAIELEALEGAATEVLLGALLGDVQVDDDLRSTILERASGNPLFVEELVRSIGDDSALAASRRTGRLGQEHIQVPPSLTGLLTSRLDRLDEPTRQVAQVASVIGREFDLPTLVAAVGAQDGLETATSELVRRGILEEQRRIPEPVYSFRHALIQETAYSTVLLRTRRDLHGRVARHLVAHDADDAHEIARHFLEAGDTASAFPHLVETGRRATRAMALRDAISSFSAALESPPADADPDLILAAHDGLGEAYSLIPDLSQASATFQSLLDYGRATGLPTMQVTALNRLGFSTAALAGDYDGAMRYLADARALAEEVGDDLGLAEYHMNACFVTAFQGDFDRAVEHDDATARLGQRAGNEVIRLTGLVRKAVNLVATWRFDEARSAYEEGVEVAGELDDDEIAAVLEANCATGFALRDGDLHRALELLRAALPTIDRYTSYHGPAAYYRFGECAGYAGDVEAALSAYATTERYGRTLSQPSAVSAGAAGRARVLAACGVNEGVDELRAEAVELVASATGEFFGTSVWADLARANLARGALDAAAADFAVAFEASGVTAMWERPRVLFGLARIALAQGGLDAARTSLDQVRGLVSTHGVRLYEPELFVLDGALAAAEGRDADATTLLTEAVSASTEAGQALTRIEALGRLAAVRSRQGDGDEAEALRERAQSSIRELTNLIADVPLRESFSRVQLAAMSALASSG
ncbi:MAG TPA: adenylate/guanylate cyclase domain-containing protein [Nitriliruptorales bacterium]